MEIIEVTSTQKDKILAYEETHFLDLKAIEISPAKLTRALAAFANADGGELYIGIDEDKSSGLRKWRGFKNQEDANGHLQCFDEVFPLGQDCHYTFLSCQTCNGLILRVEVYKTASIKYATDRKVYVRKGAQNLPINSEEKLRQLRLVKGIESFETETVSADIEVISNSIPVLKFLLEVIPTPPEPKEWLSKNNLIQRGIPTVAGVLLFAEVPQAFLPKRCGIKVYRYKTSEAPSRETLDFNPITIEGHLYEQIYTAVGKVKDIIDTIPLLGKSGLEKIQYPEETLHEIITNAVLHRDYSVADDIHVRIFDLATRHQTKVGSE